MITSPEPVSLYQNNYFETKCIFAGVAGVAVISGFVGVAGVAGVSDLIMKTFCLAQNYTNISVSRPLSESQLEK